MAKAASRVAAGKRSKRKGNTFERDVAKMLQEWWQDGDFVRTPSSGGWQKDREGFRSFGDITTNSKDFPFSVECKFHAEWDLGQFFTSPKAYCVHQWRQQAVEETPDNYWSLLIMKANRKPILVAFDSKGLELLDMWEDKYALFQNGADKYVVMLFEDFLKKTPQEVKRVFY